MVAEERLELDDIQGGIIPASRRTTASSSGY